MSDYSLAILALDRQKIPYSVHDAAAEYPACVKYASASHTLLNVKGKLWVFTVKGWLIGTWGAETQKWEIHGSDSLIEMVDWRLDRQSSLDEIFPIVASSSNLPVYCKADWTYFPAVRTALGPHGEKITFTCERFLLCNDDPEQPSEDVSCS